MLTLDLLGPVQLRCDGRVLPLTVRKTAALLVLLALAGPQPRGRVVALLWPGLDESTGRRNLRRELARLREIGAAPAVLAEADRLRLAPGLHTGPAAAIDRDDAPPGLAEGLELDDAPEFMQWLAAERQRGQRRALEQLEAAAAEAEARGERAEALRLLERLLAADPLQERHHRQAMRLLAASGRREAALARFRACRELLRDELGLAPMPETEALAAELAAGAGDASAPSPAMPPAPRPGAAAAPPPCATAARLPPLLPPLLPFVGREAEVARLERAWRDAATVLVEGEGGVGKSRLVVDFVAAHGPHAVVRCHPADAQLPLASLARALRVLAGPAPSTTGLPGWVVAELPRLLPELGPPPPRALRSEGERERLADAIAIAWQHWGTGNFDAVVLDDWHLADGASQALLPRLLARRDAALPLREWLVYRPELPPAAAAQLARLREGGAVHLALGPLAADAVYELLQRLSGAERPERFARRLAGATGGHPFHLAETLRHLAEQGLLQADAAGVWCTPFDVDTHDYRELPLPATVRDAVLARVQRLAEPARRVLDAAALAGEPFRAAQLAGACALGEVECELALEQALDARLLQERPDGAGFAFAHDLVPQALVQSMDPARQRRVHRRLALCAEAAGAAPATIALHFEAGGEPLRALPWRLRAAELAMQLLALDEAIAHGRQARADAGAGAAEGAPAAAADGDTLLAIGCGLVRAQDLRGDHDAARAEMQQLLALLRTGRGSAPARTEALLCAATQCTNADEPQAALDLLAQLPATLDPHALATAARVRVDALRGLGRIAESEAVATEALTLPALPDDDRGKLFDALTMTALTAGRMHAALGHVEAARAASLAAGDRWGEVRAAVRRAALLAQIGDPAEAEAALRSAADEAGRLGMTGQQRATLFNLCVLHAGHSRPAAVLAVARECWALPPPMPREALRTQLQLAFVEAHGALGELGEAWRWLQGAVDDALAIGQIAGLATTLLTGLELLTLLGEPQRAMPLLQALAERGESGHYGSEMSLVRAECALLCGDTAAAHEALRAWPGPTEVPRVAVREAVLRAALALAEGRAGEALARLPPDDAPGHNDELRWRAWAVRLRAEQAQGGVQAATRAQALAALPREGVHAVALWLLHRALAAVEPPQAAACAARGRALAVSLAAHPLQQRAFVERWG